MYRHGIRCVCVFQAICIGQGWWHQMCTCVSGYMYRPGLVTSDVYVCFRLYVSARAGDIRCVRVFQAICIGQGWWHQTCTCVSGYMYRPGLVTSDVYVCFRLYVSARAGDIRCVRVFQAICIGQGWWHQMCTCVSGYMYRPGLVTSDVYVCFRLYVSARAGDIRCVCVFQAICIGQGWWHQMCTCVSGYMYRPGLVTSDVYVCFRLYVSARAGDIRCVRVFQAICIGQGWWHQMCTCVSGYMYRPGLVTSDVYVCFRLYVSARAGDIRCVRVFQAICIGQGWWHQMCMCVSGYMYRPGLGGGCDRQRMCPSLQRQRGPAWHRQPPWAGRCHGVIRHPTDGCLSHCCRYWLLSTADHLGLARLIFVNY